MSNARSTGTSKHAPLIATCALAASCTYVSPARARPPALDWIPVPLRAIGTPLAAGGHAGGRAPRGPFLGIDGGIAVLLAKGNRDAQDSFSFGVRAGYAFRNGISVFGRYDDLGVEPIAASDARLQAATLGVRYAIPFLVPLPFLEVMAGGMFGAADPPTPAAAAGLGVSLPIDRVALDLCARDWFASLDGSMRQTITLQLGISVVF